MRVLRGSLTLLSLVAASELHAESPGIPALNRYFGLGWGQGYHASSVGCPGQTCCPPLAYTAATAAPAMQPTAGGIWAPAPAPMVAPGNWAAPPMGAPPALPASPQTLPDPRTGAYVPRPSYPVMRPASIITPPAPVLYYPTGIAQPAPVAPRGLRLSIP